MLNSNEFVQDSISINLYYLRTLRTFCLNVQTSSPAHNASLIQEAERIALECERLGKELVSTADYRVSKKTIDSQILVTPYTLESEELTEKLFNINIATDITKEELNLTAGSVVEVSSNLENTIDSLNQQAFILAEEFVSLCQDIFVNLNNNNLFSYTYPTMFQFMIHETESFINELERLSNRSKTDPGTVLSFEYAYNDSMKTIAVFINKLVDPTNFKIVNSSAEFIDVFTRLQQQYRNTILSPDSQKQLTENEIVVVEYFQKFVQECIEDVLNQRAYFIIEPIFLDNMYRIINYFLFLLNSNQENQ